MVKKIISNKNLIAKFLSLLAIALILPEVINLFRQNFNDNVFYLILHISAIVCGVIIFLMSNKNAEVTKNKLLIPTLLLFGGPLALNIRHLIQFNSWSYPYYIALYGAAIIMYFIFLANDKQEIKFIVYLLFAIILSMNLLGVFGGSQTSLARLILGIIIIGNVYLSERKGEDENNEEE